MHVLQVSGYSILINHRYSLCINHSDNVNKKQSIIPMDVRYGVVWCCVVPSNIIYYCYSMESDMKCDTSCMGIYVITATTMCNAIKEGREQFNPIHAALCILYRFM